MNRLLSALLRPARATGFALLTVAGLAGGANAQIATHDSPNKDVRVRDLNQNEASRNAKTVNKKVQKITACTNNDTNKYRSQLYARTPSQVLAREPANVALIRHYAKKYKVDEGLALSVAYKEGRMDSCAVSYTGVRGPMQVTEGTAKWLGFNRNVTEQNIEAGVKYLSMGVAKCGNTNYACLAKHYNGSNIKEQKGWAAGVGANHKFFSTYAGTPWSVAPAAPEVNAPDTITASAASGKKASNKIAQELANSGVAAMNNTQKIDAMAEGVGQTEDYIDTWNENTNAKVFHIDMLNQAIKSATMILQLRNELLNTNLEKQSNSVKLTTAKPQASPFSCDPTVLEKLGLPRNKWPACALQVIAGRGGDSFASVDTIDSNAAVAASLNALQRRAQASE